MEKNFIIFDPFKTQTELTRKPFSDELRALQSLVNGHIEHLTFDGLTEHYIDAWINEEGKLMNLHASMAIVHDDTLIDQIVGPIVFTRFDDEGYTYGLTDFDLVTIQNWLNRMTWTSCYDLDTGHSWFIPVHFI